MELNWYNIVQIVLHASPMGMIPSEGAEVRGEQLCLARDRPKGSHGRRAD